MPLFSSKKRKFKKLKKSYSKGWWKGVQIARYHTKNDSYDLYRRGTRGKIQSSWPTDTKRKNRNNLGF